MKLIAHLKLQPTPEQADALLRTLERANEACDSISRIAWESQTFGKFPLQTLCYTDVRETFALTAQMVIRLLAKVGDAYKVDNKICRTFRPHGSIAYDDRILSYAVQDSSVSIWTLDGRQSFHSCAVIVNGHCSKRGAAKPIWSTREATGICWPCAMSKSLNRSTL